jgi:hypothetical protein
MEVHLGQKIKYLTQKGTSCYKGQMRCVNGNYTPALKKELKKTTFYSYLPQAEQTAVYAQYVITVSIAEEIKINE